MEKNLQKLPLVTVVTAVYKKFDGLKKSIDSVFMQNYPDIEFIICDDGSGDFPEDMINEYVEENKPANIKNFELIIQKENVGTVKNLNCAYKKGKGDIFINLSCGDVFFEKNTIKKIVSVFLKRNADVVVTSRILYRNDFEPVCMLPHYNERKVIHEYDTNIKQYKALMLERYYDMASGSAMYFSRKAIEDIGYFDEKYRLWEDGPFLAKYLLKNRLEYAYEIVSIWYEDGGVSSKKKAAPHPIMQKDIILFNHGEKLLHKEFFSLPERMLLNYQAHRSDNFSKSKGIIFKLLHIPQIVLNLLYVRKRNKLSVNDKKAIDVLMKKRKI